MNVQKQTLLAGISLIALVASVLVSLAPNVSAAEGDPPTVSLVPRIEQGAWPVSAPLCSTSGGTAGLFNWATTTLPE